MWSIGGGKGGVGKSIVAVSLAYWLGRMNHSVILVDGDLGGANLHTLLGIRVPKLTLEDFLMHRVQSLEEALLPTPFENVRLLAGGYEMTSLANPNYGQKTRVLRALHRLRADHILVDLGGGTGLNVLDFFLASPNRLVVTTPQPTAIQNGYGFIKSALYRALYRSLPNASEAKSLLNMVSEEEGVLLQRTLEQVLQEVAAKAPDHLRALEETLRAFQVSLIINMARDAREAKKAEIIIQVCRRYLNIEIEPLGSLPQDESIERWAARMDPTLFIQSGNSGVQQASYEIAYRLRGSTALAA